MTIAGPIDKDWYNAYKAVQSLTDSEHDKSIKYYIKVREDKIKELEATIRLYQRTLSEIHKISTI